jgi:hypothetical protein
MSTNYFDPDRSGNDSQWGGYDPWLDESDFAGSSTERFCKRCRGTGQQDGADCLDCEGWGSTLI